jgi:hypothetical protein
MEKFPRPTNTFSSGGDQGGEFILEQDPTILNEKLVAIKARREAATRAALKGISNVLYVGNITDVCDESVLRSLFPFAIQYEQYTTYALVYFETAQDAVEQLNHQPLNIENRVLVLRVLSEEERELMEAVGNSGAAEEDDVVAYEDRDDGAEDDLEGQFRVEDCDFQYVFDTSGHDCEEFVNQIEWKVDVEGDREQEGSEKAESSLENTVSYKHLDEDPKAKEHFEILHSKFYEWWNKYAINQGGQPAKFIESNIPPFTSIEHPKPPEFKFHCRLDYMIPDQTDVTTKEEPTMYPMITLGIGRTAKEAKYECMSNFMLYGPPVDTRAIAGREPVVQ